MKIISNHFKYYLSLGMLIMLICSCSENTTTPDPIDNPDPSEPGKVQNISNAMATFGISTLQKIAEEKPDSNVVISPLSLSLALYMAYNGSVNGTETQTQMDEVLGLDMISKADLNVSVEKLLRDLSNDNINTTLGIANGVFSDPNRITIKENFVNQMSQFYTAPNQELNFSAGESVDFINNWVKEKTEDRIEKIINQIQGDEIMFLINALFFTGDWLNPFAEEETRMLDFISNSATIPEVPFMNLDFSQKYLNSRDLKIVELPFADEKFSMTFVQNSQYSTINDWITALDAEEILGLNDGMSTGRIKLRLPKFELKFEDELSEIYKELGMVNAFSGGGLEDFGSAAGVIYLSRVNHNVVLKIDEKGAEGAAVTSVGVGAESVPPPIFFDEPFLFYIKHIETNTLIFLGKIENPVE